MSFSDFDDDDFDDEYDNDWESDDDESSEVEPCPHCGADVYEDAVACPHCGEYITHRRRALHSLPTWVVVVALAGMAAFVLAALRWPR